MQRNQPGQVARSVFLGTAVTVYQAGALYITPHFRQCHFQRRGRAGLD